MGQTCSCERSDFAKDDLQVQEPQVQRLHDVGLHIEIPFHDILLKQAQRKGTETDSDVPATEASTDASPARHGAGSSIAWNSNEDDLDFGSALDSPKGEVDYGLTQQAAEEVVAAAMAKVEALMKDYDILEAESVFAQALDQLGCLDQEAAAASPAGRAAAEQLRASELYKDVLEFVSQYDPTVDMLYSDKYDVLYENKYGKFELYQPEGEQWFDYRMTVNIDASLAECLAPSNELDLVPLAQTAVHEKPVRIGPENDFLKLSITKLPALIFNCELCFESLRVRDKRSGFLLESIRGLSFPARGRTIPEKPWRTIRPWTWVANAWVPRGGGKEGTVLTQVTRVDPGFHVPKWVLSWIFKSLASNFMRDLRDCASKAATEGSPWKKRIEEDKLSFYRGLQEVDKVASMRAEVAGLPPKAFFENRLWRLRPQPLNTQPPCSHKYHAKH